MTDKTNPIREVYEKYKHLDHLLSDRDWLFPVTPLMQALYDLWQSVKQSMEEDNG